MEAGCVLASAPSSWLANEAPETEPVAAFSDCFGVGDYFCLKTVTHHTCQNPLLILTSVARASRHLLAFASSSTVVRYASVDRQPFASCQIDFSICSLKIGQV